MCSCNISLLQSPSLSTYNTTGCLPHSLIHRKHVVGPTADDNRDSLVSRAAKRARSDKLEKAAAKSLRVQVSMPVMFQRDVTKEQVSTAGSCLPCLKPSNHPYGHCLWSFHTIGCKYDLDGSWSHHVHSSLCLSSAMSSLHLYLHQHSISVTQMPDRTWTPILVLDEQACSG